MCNGLPWTTLSYSGDALRSFNVQPTSQLRRDVRKRLFSLRIWSPRYKHVNKGNSNVKQSFDHSVTVRKSVPGVKLGVINCQSISGKLDFVFDHIKEYQLDIVALTETWLSSEDSRNKHVIDQCVAHGYSLHHSPRTSGRRGGVVGLLVSNAIKVTFKRIHHVCSISLRLIVIYCIHPSKINRLKTRTFYVEFSENLEKLSCASGKVIIHGDFNIFFLDTSGFAYKRFVDILETFNCVQHIDKPTHNSGHLLDYIITEKDSSSVSNLYVSVWMYVCMDVKTAFSNSKSEILQKKYQTAMVIRKKLFKIVATLLGRNNQTTLPKYDSPLTMASVMNNFFIDKINNIRAEFPLLEANLPCYSFLSMDSIMPICTTTLYHFDRVTDPEL